MRDFYLIVNWTVTLALLGLGFVALLKNRKLSLNRRFAAFTATIGIWIMASYVSNDIANTPHTSVIGNYFVFLFSYVSAYLLLWFAVALSENKRAARGLRRLIVPIVLVGAVSATPLVVAGAVRQGQVYAVQFGPLVSLYFLGLVAALSATMLVLRKGIKSSSGVQKSHQVILYRSLIVAIPVLLITEFILPTLTGWFGLTDVGILAMAIPVMGLYYSVVKLKLFNLRFVVVRALAYTLAVTVIGIVYGSLSYYLTTLIKSSHNNAAPQEVLNIALIMGAITAYTPMTRVFRRWSNKLFYRDAYDSQELFDQLNRLLVSTTDLDKLLNQVATLIVGSLKPQSCLFVLEKTSYSARRSIGIKENDHQNSEKFFAKFYSVTVVPKGRTIIVDDLSQSYKDLKHLLEVNGTAVLIRLMPKSSQNEADIGYMMLGPKKSGYLYDNQDLRVLDTIANELVIATQNVLHYEEIQHFNETLQQRVEDATRRLSETNKKLKMMDETKDDFIGMASHQLRTPLTSVKGYLSLVLEGDAGKITSQQRKLLTQAFISSQRMVFLIADLLNVSRLKTGKFIIEPSPISLADMITDEMSQLKETAQARELALDFQKPDNFPLLNLDETKTRQVVMNFLDNAIYYTPSGGHITVTLSELSRSVELRISDDGIGVPKEEQHHLFSKFYRAKNAQKARPDGTGLGLFMAKKVIIAQGGALIFESKEGEGSTFGFTFPKALVKATPRPTV